MGSELKRGLIRITSNYTRVVATVVLGLMSVPLLIRATGDDGWALIALLGSTIGLTSMIQEIVQLTMIRELGAAYHSKSADDFPVAYNASLVISLAFSVLALTLFAILWLLIPIFEIPAHLVSAARWLVVAKGIESFFVLLLAAPFNMIRVTERMVVYNAWSIVQKSCYVIAAILVIMMQLDDPAQAVSNYAFFSTGMLILTMLIPVGTMVWLEPRLIPAPSRITSESIKSALQVAGWNIGASTASKLHRHIAPIIMNLAFGLPGNLILGLAIQLTVSVRRLTAGMTDGIDAVSARLSTVKGHGAVRRLLYQSTRLHGLATFPVMIGVLFLTEPALQLWVGRRLEDPDIAIPQATTLIRIMVLGMAARAIADGWIRILYGAGHVARYAPMVLAGGLANPILAIFLIWLLPEPLEYTGVVWAFSTVLVVIHGGLVPLIGARTLEIPYHQFFLPMFRPLIIALLCTPILVYGEWQIERWTLTNLTAVVTAYAVAYCVLFALFGMDHRERERITKAVLRRIPWPLVRRVE